MPAPITPPKQAKVIELYQGGLKIKEIAESLGVNRNTVASILKSGGDTAAKGNAAAPLSSTELYKLRYLHMRLVGTDTCPNCKQSMVFLQTDREAPCQTCGKRWQIDPPKRA